MFIPDVYSFNQFSESGLQLWEVQSADVDSHSGPQQRLGCMGRVIMYSFKLGISRFSATGVEPCFQKCSVCTTGTRFSKRVRSHLGSKINGHIFRRPQEMDCK